MMSLMRPRFRIPPLILLSVGILLAQGGCVTDRDSLYTRSPELLEQLQGPPPRFPKARFIVLSDPHIYDSTLGITGDSCEARLQRTPLLLAESVEIFQELIGEIRREEPDFVLVCGDLTKDGERVSHERLALLIKEIEEEGVAVYVVPGNHDISNPHAERYAGNSRIVTESVSESEFAQLYGNFGYQEAKLRDSSSLSYVVEPVEGLWLIGMDSCRYRESGDYGGGRIYPQTIRWLQEVLLQATIEGKAVLGFVHHGILEHFNGQARYASEFLVQDNDRVARFLAGHNMQIVFTGHMHSQDAVEKEWTAGGESIKLLDVETGSLASFPCPFRIVDIVPGLALPDRPPAVMRIRTRYITSIESRRRTFSRYAYWRSYQATRRAIRSRLKNIWVADESAPILSDWLALSVLAHFMGDERAERNPVDPDRLSFWPRFVARAAAELIEGLWNDLEPPDNDLILPLN